MPAEEEQLHQPGTSDEQQTPTPQSESTALPQATCKQEVPEAEQKPIEKDHREENADCEKKELPKVENQPHAVEQEPERHTASETPEHQHGGTVVSAVKEETKTHDISLTSAQCATTPPEKEEKAEPTSPPVKSSTNASEESAVGEKVAVDEEDEEDEDDEDEAPDNEEQVERERSREDGFNNEEERAVVHSTQPHQQQQHNNRQDQSQTPTGGQFYEDDEEDEEEEGEERSELRQLFEPINDSQVQSEDEEDGDYIPDEEVKKTIMVGSDFQAVIPEGLCRYDDALPYENEDKLLWNPTILNEQEIVDYLLKITSPTVGTSLTTGGAATAAGGGTGGGVGGQQQQQQQKNSAGAGAGPDPQTNSVYAIPLGNHLRDDEQSLYLLQQCGHNIDEALRRRRITSNAVPVPEQQMSIWSEEECRNFENGLRVHGKDFHMIQQTKVRTRSVGELVQFYYLWKKTERHDLFASKARLDKKKYNLHPGLTDHMDRFLEEQENSTGFGDRSSSPGFSSLYNSTSEAKRQRLLDSKENNNTASSKRGAASNL